VHSGVSEGIEILTAGKMKRGFTLIELVVAVAILALVSSFAGAIFSVSIDSHRTSMANAEIMRKLRAITDQLNADFSGLRKDGEIFVVWAPVKAGSLIDWESYADDADGYVRFDRIMFFANGDFQAYRDGSIRGNVARICYMVGNKGNWEVEDERFRAGQILRGQRVLTRTQHILAGNADLPPFPEPNQLTPTEVHLWRNGIEVENVTIGEADRTTMAEWKRMSWGAKAVALSAMTDVIIGDGMGGGAFAEASNPDSIPMFLCEGVGEFKIQGWYSYDAERAILEDRPGRWVPEYAEGDFVNLVIDEGQVGGVLYPGSPFGAVQLGGEFYCDRDTSEGEEKHRELVGRLNEERFNEIPGLGRALKFTFTLYDSKGIIKEGRTFTHIVYLDN
jgi:prepilin-type N-terminal cleavage/methylation domain-containing protein